MHKLRRGAEWSKQLPCTSSLPSLQRHKLQLLSPVGMGSAGRLACAEAAASSRHAGEKSLAVLSKRLIQVPGLGLLSQQVQMLSQNSSRDRNRVSFMEVVSQLALCKAANASHMDSSTPSTSLYSCSSTDVYLQAATQICH